ncbi:MAG: AAA family ATPase [Nitrosopumilaceae archaeon]|jgi:exonuclease SbcC
MIKKLVINNFQNWENAKFNFCPGVNIIVGPTDSGKSAFYRILKWIFQNVPSGDGYVQHGQDMCKGIVVLDDNTKVIRKRIKNNNEYKIIKGEIKKSYKAFGQKVPEDIQTVINLEDINFQDQSDSHFLLSKSSGEISRYFNKVVDLEKIDDVIKGAEKERRETVTKINYIDSEIKEEEKELLEYEWIDAAEKELLQLEKLENAVDKIKDKVIKIDEIILENKKIEDYQVEINLKNANKEYREINVKHEELKRHKSILEKLKNIETSLNELNIGIEQTTKLISKSQKKYNEVMGDRCPLCQGEIK